MLKIHLNETCESNWNNLFINVGNITHKKKIFKSENILIIKKQIDFIPLNLVTKC